MAQPLPGDLVGGRYRLESVLGRGGMGVVHRATDTLLQREVALKVMGEVSDDSFRARFAHEATVLARLDSPHVVAIHDHGEHRTDDDVAAGRPGAPYLVTQLVAGGDLGTHLSRLGALPPRVAAAVVAQVAGALRDAHAAGIVHRDVKPANVLVRDADALRTDDLHVYLCDFGIAQTTSDDLTTPGPVAGTWTYLAPERARGRAASPASDVYAAGCLLWACLTGRAPHVGSDLEVALAHQQQPVPQLRRHDGGLGDALDAVLRRSMAKDPADRYADAGALRADLLALPRDDDRGPTPPRRVPPAAPAAPAAPVGPGRRRGLVAALVALAVVTAAAAGVGLASLLGGDGDGGGGSGDPQAGAPVRDVTGDVDGDGLGDVAVAGLAPTGTVLVTWPGSPDGVGTPEEVVDRERTRNVALRGDLDGDGVEEYVSMTSTPGGDLLLRPVDGDAGWRVRRAGAEVPPVVGDFDGDGVDDLALLGHPDGGGFDEPLRDGAEVRLALGGREARTAQARAVGAGWDPTTDLLVAGDLDADGDDDLVLVRPQGYRGGDSGSVTLTALLAEGGALSLGPESASFGGLAGAFPRAVDRAGDGLEEVAVVAREGGTEVRMFALDDTSTLVETEPWGSVGGLHGPRLGPRGRDQRPRRGRPRRPPAGAHRGRQREGGPGHRPAGDRRRAG